MTSPTWANDAPVNHKPCLCIVKLLDLLTCILVTWDQLTHQGHPS